MDRSLPPWPPELSEPQLHSLTLLATSWALSHGLLYLPQTTESPPAPTTAIHAPITLFPTPFPRTLFSHAQALQRIYNVLYSRVAMDVDFLDSVMGAVDGVGKIDSFVGQLWRGWKQTRDERLVPPLHLGLFRSDYLMHDDPETGERSLKQVEFNTISSSFGPLSCLTSAMHQYLLASTNYYRATPLLRPENLPPNNALTSLVQALAAAHNAYGRNDARILFVVQDGERNVFDQRWLEYELLEKHSISVVRQTFDQLANSLALSSTSRTLHITLPTEREAAEISVVYYRAGYTPNDYPTPAHYDTRFKLEASRAIQCPSIALQLAGGKIVQETLSRPGVVEDFLLDERRGTERFEQRDVDVLRASWMEMWVLSLGGGGGGEGVRRARAEAAQLVLKPQREGGGNNIYRSAIPRFLEELPAGEREAWIAMRLIQPPRHVGNWLVRAGGGSTGRVRSDDVVSELGVFGWALFGGDKGGGEIVQESGEAGWLVRTKGRESDEGGVAVGFSVLDSVVLTD